MDEVRLSKLLALTISDNDHEALLALRTAQKLMNESGRRLSELVPHPAPPRVDFMAGFEDFMEEKEPGYKARAARERAERERRRQRQRDLALAKYGDIERVLAPCERGRILQAAVAHLIEIDAGGFEIPAGWYGHGPIPEPLVKAVTDAYPLPQTIAEARAEYRYWEDRSQELDLFDAELHLPALARRNIVRPLYAHVLPIASEIDLALRMNLLVEATDPETAEESPVWDRDLPHLVSTLRRAILARRPAGDDSQRVDAALARDGHLDDKEIARLLGVSPQMVAERRRIRTIMRRVRAMREAAR